LVTLVAFFPGDDESGSVVAVGELGPSADELTPTVCVGNETVMDRNHGTGHFCQDVGNGSKVSET
jgi:hypothetical protein